MHKQSREVHSEQEEAHVFYSHMKACSYILGSVAETQRARCGKSVC